MENSKFYAGIGSRDTPEAIKPTIHRLVKRLNELGYTLRSGGADGADKFFEEYATDKEIFLPWHNFNGNKSHLFEQSSQAFEIAKKYHPVYERLSYGAKRMMARNCYQVLGKSLKSPVEFVLCWTKDGKASGGTGQAIRIAEDYKIPVYNLNREGDTKKLFEKLWNNDVETKEPLNSEVPL